MNQYSLDIDSIPWHRIITTYGTAKEFPQYFKILWDMDNSTQVKNALSEIISNAEHQSTLLPVTPFATIFLVDILKHTYQEMDNHTIAVFIVKEILSFFEVIAECFHDTCEMFFIKQQNIKIFSDIYDILLEEYLLPNEYDEEDEDILIEEIMELFSEELAYNIYYYSYQAILQCKEWLSTIKSNTSITQEIRTLLALLY